jgi:Uma2 family endonuclease
MAQAAASAAPLTFDPAVAMDREAFAAQTPFVLPDCTWEQYLAMDAAFADQRGVRIRFLQGYLEIMFPTSLEHERRKSHLG